MKKLTTILCAACLAFTGAMAAMPAELTASAAAMPYPTKGKAGENITWQYDVGTHTLTYSGTGDMYGSVYLDVGEDLYEITDSSQWFCPKKIVIEEGITSIGGGACSPPYYRSADPELVVEFPKSVTKIGAGAFSGATVYSLVIPETVREIDEKAFNGCINLRSITIENPDCEIAQSSDTICNTFIETTKDGSYQYYGVIFGAAGSTAEAYAEKFNRQFAVTGTEVELNPLKPTERGDFDGDDKISIEDAQNVLLAYTEMLAGNAPKLNALQKNTCDVDRDGDVDVTDAQYILIYYTECTLLNPDMPPTEYVSWEYDWEKILSGKSLQDD
jgi:hypothetical protein